MFARHGDKDERNRSLTAVKINRDKRQNLIQRYQIGCRTIEPDLIATMRSLAAYLPLPRAPFVLAEIRDAKMHLKLIERPIKNRIRGV